MAHTYDEDVALSEYICTYYASLMSTEESATLQELHQRVKQPGRFEDNPKREDLWVAIRELKTRACKRILEHYQDEVAINRCPECDAVCRTPDAQMCVRCGHHWHEDR